MNVETLTAAFIAAKDAADQAQGTEDDGTCNFDTALFFLPRADKKVLEAATRTGVRLWKSEYFGRKCWMFAHTHGQGAMRTRMARASEKALIAHGMDAHMYYAMD